MSRSVVNSWTSLEISLAILPRHTNCRTADLDLGRLATAFGLLRVPRMPEIKHASVALRHFSPSAVDPDSVKARARGPLCACGANGAGSAWGTCLCVSVGRCLHAA